MTARQTLLATTLLAMVATRTFAADPDLLVFDWAGFEDPKLHIDYTEKYGQEPSYSFYGDDDEAFQKLQSGFKADVAHPCSQMVQKYRDAGLVEPWDTAKIPEYKDITPAFLDSKSFVDDEGTWFIPTDWASTAIAWNRKEVPPEDVASLDVFVNPKYQGRISLPDNTDDIWALAYLATGVDDWTTVTDAQFEAAAAWLRKAHENVRAYWGDPAEMAQLMATGEVLVAWSWPEGVGQLRSDGFDIGFQREAKEGSSAFLCGYVNLKDAPGKEDKAYDFINAWLDPQTAQNLLDDFGYGHSNGKAMEAIGKAEVADAGLGPVDVPVLQQLPMDISMRNRMLQEFEKIKAGF